jgi:hypothetical protein
MTQHILNLKSYSLQKTGLSRTHELLNTESYINRTGEFDFKTLFYDIVPSDSDIFLYCPKLFNLEKLVKESEFYIDDILQKICVKKCSRYDVIKIKATGNKLTIKNQYFNDSWDIQKFNAARFANKNCIVTGNKNNNLEWIADFVKFHIRHHQLDVIIIFDNNSDKYTLNDLAACLHKTGVNDFLIVAAPFPFGPILKDRNQSLCFLQTTLINLAKEKLLTLANAVLVIDIDELIWTKNKTVFQMAQSSLLGVVLFNGEWRFPANNTQPITHQQHQYLDKEINPCPTKYCYAPNKITRFLELGVHRVYFKRTHLRNFINYLLLSTEVGYWHCFGISTNWKGNRAINTVDQKVDKLFSKHFL